MTQQKILIFDSSSLINFVMNGLTQTLVDLKKIFRGKFIITDAVKYETIDRPSNIKKFELGSLQIKKLLDEKILEMPSAININESVLREKTKIILNHANSSFEARNEYMHIIDAGEASCLALSLLAGEKNIGSIIVIDERTTRMLGENPENLRELFETKLHTKVLLRKDFEFPEFRFIRSSELVYVAYKKGFVNLKNGDVLDALLYAVKYKGCSISRQEIEEIKRL